LWHLIGLVAAAAALCAVLQFRRDVDNPTYFWIRRLRSLDAEDRLQAVRALSELGPIARPAIEPLLEALADRDVRVRRMTPDALSAILGRDSADPSAGAVSAALTAALGDHDLRARHATAIGLGWLFRSPRVVVPALTEVLQDDDGSVRSTAVNLLGPFAPHNHDARTVILGALEDGDPFVRMAAVRSLSWCHASPQLIPSHDRTQIPGIPRQAA
jgi:HEAT repeat protein